MSTDREINITLTANGWDGEFDTIRHAVAVAIKHHEDALKRNKGGYQGRRARLTHESALEHLQTVSRMLSAYWASSSILPLRAEES